MSPMSRRAADPATPLPSPKERRRLREARALSEEQIAEAMGVTRATVRSWETGRTDPRGRKREAYAKLLGAHEEAHASASTGGASGGLGAHARDEAREEAHPPGARAFDTAPGTSPAPGQEATGAEPAPEPSARHAPAGPQPSTGPTANTRPRTAAKRAARPPENPAPGPTPLHTPQERLKPGGSGTGPRSTAHPTDTPAGAAPQRAAEGERGEETAVEPSLTPEGAFDALYAHAAPGLVHQTYLLTGRRGLSRESVEHAFLLAWQRWPEVAVDRDPVGWVRAAAYEYALSPGTGCAGPTGIPTARPPTPRAARCWRPCWNCRRRTGAPCCSTTASASTCPRRPPRPRPARPPRRTGCCTPARSSAVTSPSWPARRNCSGSWDEWSPRLRRRRSRNPPRSARTASGAAGRGRGRPSA